MNVMTDPLTAGETAHLAVNGTLMRGLKLNHNLTDVGARFVREDATADCYRIWSINDAYPAMLRTDDGTGTAVALEIWDVPLAGLAKVLLNEPAGLTMGKVLLADKSQVLGIIGEPFLVKDQREITAHAGWRAYIGTSR
jgi:hypothetical protein